MYVQVARPPHHTRGIPFRLASEVEESAINSAYNTARKTCASDLVHRQPTPVSGYQARTEQQASVLLFLEDLLFVVRWKIETCKIQGNKFEKVHVSLFEIIDSVLRIEELKRKTMLQ